MKPQHIVVLLVAHLLMAAQSHAQFREITIDGRPEDNNVVYQEIDDLFRARVYIVASESLTSIEVTSSLKIYEVKVRISQQERIPIEYQVLALRGQRLHDDVELSALSVKEENKVLVLGICSKLSCTDSELFDVASFFLGVYNKLSHTLIHAQVAQYFDIRDVKGRVEQQEGIAVAMQDLSFQGQQLADQTALAELSISEGQVMDLDICERPPCQCTPALAVEVPLLRDASYSATAPSSYTSFENIGSFVGIKAYWRSGWVSCNQNEAKDDAIAFQACAIIHDFVTGPALELQLNGQWVLQQPDWFTGAPECTLLDKRPHQNAPVTCNAEMNLQQGDLLTLGWYESFRKTSLHDNGGIISFDLYGLACSTSTTPQIIVNMYNVATRRHFQIKVLETAWTRDIKYQIQNAESVPVEVQVLAFQGRRLQDDSADLAALGIDEGAVLELGICDKASCTDEEVLGDASVTLTVYHVAAKQALILQVKRYFRVGELKQQILQTESVPVEVQVLAFQGRRLQDDSADLAALGIDEGAVLELGICDKASCTDEEVLGDASLSIVVYFVRCADHSTGTFRQCSDLSGATASGSFAGIDKCFFVPSSTASWDVAELQCSSYGGHLASISSATENDHAYDVYVTSGARDSHGAVWIGLSDNENNAEGAFEGTFKWSDASTSSYTNWDNGEPNNHGGDQDCANMWKDAKRWDDAHCSTALPYMCAVNVGQPKICPVQGSVQAPGSNKCYFSLNMVADWSVAQQECAKHGGHLASIESAEENEFVYQIFLNSEVSAGHSRLWIGMSDLLNEGLFTWSDGRDINYQNWRWGEPNDYGTGEDCGSMYTADKSWNDLSCVNPLPFVCSVTAVDNIQQGVGSCMELEVEPGRSTIPLDVKRYSTVADVRQLIANTAGVAPINQVLAVHGQRLQDNTEMSALGIEDGGMLLLGICNKASCTDEELFGQTTLPVTVYVGPTRQVTSLITMPYFRVAEAKAMIAQTEGIPVEVQVLALEDQRLHDDAELAALGEGAVLELGICNKASCTDDELFQDAKISIGIYMARDQQRRQGAARQSIVSLDVKRYDRVSNVKDEILKTEGIPVAHQVLRFQSQQLQDGTELAAIGIDGGQVLILGICDAAPCEDDELFDDAILSMNILVLPEQRHLGLDVPIFSSIIDVKVMIELALQTPVGSQILAFDDRRLDDSEHVESLFQDGEQMLLGICEEAFCTDLELFGHHSTIAVQIYVLPTGTQPRSNHSGCADKDALQCHPAALCIDEGGAGRCVCPEGSVGDGVRAELGGTGCGHESWAVRVELDLGADGYRPALSESARGTRLQHWEAERSGFSDLFFADPATGKASWLDTSMYHTVTDESVVTISILFVARNEAEAALQALFDRTFGKPPLLFGTNNSRLLSLPEVVPFASPFFDHQITLHVLNRSSVHDLKTQIEQMHRYSTEEQILGLDGQILKDNMTVPQGEVLLLGLCASPSCTYNDLFDDTSMTLTVYVASNQQVVTISVMVYFNVGEVKDTILHRTGIPVETQVLALQGRRLQDDSADLAALGIDEGAVLELGICDKASCTDEEAFDGSTMKIGIYVVPTRENIAIDVKRFVRVGDVKREIEQSTGLPVEEQALGFQGRRLQDDSADLAALGIDEGAVLELGICDKASCTDEDLFGGASLSLSVYVVPTQSMIEVRARRYFHVSDVKAQVSQHLPQCTIEMQMLAFEGQALADNVGLEAGGLREGAVLTLGIWWSYGPSVVRTGVR